MVPFSLFADPKRILRRLYVFAEEPCKSTNTTSEPCSPVFKEAQPRPSEHSNLEYHINNLNLYLDCSLFIIVIKAIQPDCDKIKGISVLLLETPLTRSKYISPYTHAQCLTRTSGTFCTFAYKQTLQQCILLECILVQVLVRYHCHFSISLLIHLMYGNNDMKFLIKKYSTFKNSKSNEIKANYLRHLSTNIYETV